MPSQNTQFFFTIHYLTHAIKFLTAPAILLARFAKKKYRSNQLCVELIDLIRFSFCNRKAFGLVSGISAMEIRHNPEVLTTVTNEIFIDFDRISSTPSHDIDNIVVEF